MTLLWSLIEYIQSYLTFLWELPMNWGKFVVVCTAIHSSYRSTSRFSRCARLEDSLHNRDSSTTGALSSCTKRTKLAVFRRITTAFATAQLSVSIASTTRGHGTCRNCVPTITEQHTVRAKYTAYCLTKSRLLRPLHANVQYTKSPLRKSHLNRKWR